jgi:hypothetical protein
VEGTIEPGPDAARDPQEFMEMGGKGDQVLYEQAGSIYPDSTTKAGEPAGSIYPDSTTKAAPPADETAKEKE